MYTFMLVLIYLAFISLGLPDSLLGAGWPVMHSDMNVPLSYAGILSMIISGGTIISSLLSDRITRKINTGPATVLSVVLTALALFGFSVSDNLLTLCIWAVPYGLGAGTIDAALNNYVALHYSSRHMSWLHCFWGVGTIISPYIMSYFLTQNENWQGGYRFVTLIQFFIAVILLVTLPLWKKVNRSDKAEKNNPGNNRGSAKSAPLSLKKALSIKGVKPLLTGFFAYCSLEATVMLWAASYLVRVRNIASETAAAFAALFFIGITAGRFVSGIFSEKAGDYRLIRIGTAVMVLGVLCIVIPAENDIIALSGFIIIGLGCAPVYPSIIHSTPDNFGRENSGGIIGIQMASAYFGSTFMPPVFGLIANYISIMLLPVYLFIFIALMFVMIETVKKTVKNAR